MAIKSLEARVLRLETAFTEGLARIESLIRQEIQELKTEQLKDLRTANERLSDDQRALWDVVHAMQLDRSGDLGSKRAVSSMTHGITGFFSGGVGAFLTWLFTRGTPH